MQFREELVARGGPAGSPRHGGGQPAYAPLAADAEGPEGVGEASGAPRAGAWSRRWRLFVELCHLRVSGDTLCVLRIGFGLILLLQHQLWYDMPAGTPHHDRTAGTTTAAAAAAARV